MFKIVNLCEVVISYKDLFRDEDGCWLKCPGEFENSQCVCLDSVELDLAGLHIDKNDDPDINFTCKDSYILALSNPLNNAKSNKSLTWCSDKWHIKNASSPKNERKTKKTKRRVIREVTNYDLILVLLCLYKANTKAMREKVTEFYLASYPKAFTKYVYKLAEFAKNKIENSAEDVMSDDELAKHIAMIQRVLNVYADNSVREAFWTRANLYEALTCYGFKQSLAKDPLDKDRLKSKLEKIREEYDATMFLPDEIFLEKIHIIFLAINTNQPGLELNMREIVKNLNCLNQKSADFSETKINIMRQINGLLSKFL